MTEEQLVNLFRKLGAKDPEGWAHSQISEGIPQLARFAFLREAWKLVIQDRDCSWIDDEIDVSPKLPGGEVAPALRRLIESGTSKEDLSTVVRVMQWKVLQGLCELLDGVSEPETGLEEIVWKLVQVDRENRPIAPLSGLHESVLETEPTGREMRAKQ